MFLLIVTIPETHLEKVKTALFEAGAGKYGGYSHCSWETQGIGQFKPLPGSAPFIGREGEVERVSEVQVQMICREEVLLGVIAALKGAHPYEVPSYQVLRTVEV